MAYSQWVRIIIKPVGINCMVDDLSLSWGKLYENGIKDIEISKDKVNKTVINAGGSYSIWSCGRSDAAAGTEGSFSLYEENGNVSIAGFHWDCPWGNKKNTFNYNLKDKINYHLDVSDYNSDSGALGDVTIELTKLSKE